MDKILITKDPKVAELAQDASIERIMVDLEVLGKQERQGHLNTVFSKHDLEDVKTIKEVLTSSKLLVRVNPINPNSQEEIDAVIDLGADIVMLPMFTTVQEVKDFVNFVDKRAKVCLLLETSQALARVDSILEISGIDEIHIGLNDLHLSMKLNFMFELLSDGIVEYLANKITGKGIKFGFGGVARLGSGALDASLILSEHYRLGSSMVILSRDFKNYKEDYDSIVSEIDLAKEVKKIDDYMVDLTEDIVLSNKLKLNNNVRTILEV